MNVPLSLINLDEMSNDTGSVLRASQGETVGMRGTVLTGVSLQDENLRRILLLLLRGYRVTPDLNRGFMNRRLRGETQIVVNFSRRNLTEAEISLLSKGLKFCPTPEKVDMYNLRKDVKEFTRRIRLMNTFIRMKIWMGTFQICQLSGRNQTGVLRRTGKWIQRHMWRHWKRKFCRIVLMYRASKIWQPALENF